MSVLSGLAERGRILILITARVQVVRRRFAVSWMKAEPRCTLVAVSRHTQTSVIRDRQYGTTPRGLAADTMKRQGWRLGYR